MPLSPYPPHANVVPAQWYRAASLLAALPEGERQEVIEQARTEAWAAGWLEATPVGEARILGSAPPRSLDAPLPSDTEALVLSTLATTERRENEGLTERGRWFQGIG